MKIIQILRLYKHMLCSLVPYFQSMMCNFAVEFDIGWDAFGNLVYDVLALDVAM